jgi:hypothetical protein
MLGYGRLCATAQPAILFYWSNFVNVFELVIAPGQRVGCIAWLNELFETFALQFP